ncbi:hypothetical protein E5676_scaffold83G00510 [Cucumis melo var. makuwa]|uniref:Uncharacterized protein n=1 Tax=Cucumis melo var. makuwa TaxID=1194695 RepID=A0A5A7TIM8_CUCMM|nr:hypothetical protein E6C27_scaffold67G002390 [Cucumis melo var. makuwa]TYK05379.1 hypothetical protein E5676_scaffold83G00510 [Cucumis melo var. makuwa]
MGKFKIDRKVFVVGNLGNGRMIYIEEKNGRKSGRLGLDSGTPTWVRDLLGGCFGFETSHGLL